LSEEVEYFTRRCFVQVWEEVLVRAGTFGQPSTKCRVVSGAVTVIPISSIGELAAALGRQVKPEVEGCEAGDGRERGENVEEGPCLVAGEIEG
jgi:hypothetical protein